MESEQLKLGFPNPRGWLAYWCSGVLFVKRAAFYSTASYFDFGSSSEVYCDHRFIELETLGSVTLLEPGETVSHKEIWEIYPINHFPTNFNDLIRKIEDH
jgi:hypothetical protein